MTLLGCHVHDASHGAVTDSLTMHAPGTQVTATPTAGIPAPVAEATIRRWGPFAAWPVLPVTIQDQQLVAALDLGSVDNYLGTATSATVGVTNFEPATVAVLTLGTRQETDVPVDSFDGVFAGADPAHGLPPVTVLLGSALLSHYDLVFDGPAGRVRLYPAQRHHFATAAQRRPAWFPPGLTSADCVPMGNVAAAEMSVVLPLTVNGHVVYGNFDSGSSFTYMNLAAARVMGLAPPHPRVHLLPPGGAPQFLIGGTEQQVWTAPSVTLTLGAHTLVPEQVLIYPDLPGETGPKQPVLNIGLDAIRDQVFYISYSSGTVCLGAASR